MYDQNLPTCHVTNLYKTRGPANCLKEVTNKTNAIPGRTII
jgi:hypothetical protein